MHIDVKMSESNNERVMIRAILGEVNHYLFGQWDYEERRREGGGEAGEGGEGERGKERMRERENE